MDEKLKVDFPGRGVTKQPGIASSPKKIFRMIKQNVELRNIVDKIPEAIILTDTEGRIQHLNKEAQSLFRVEKDDADPPFWPQELGLYLDDGLTPYPEHQLPVNLALQGKAKENEEMILRRDGEVEGIWVAMSAQPLTGQDGSVEGVVTIVRDISYRKQIELSRQKHIQRTEALYKLSHYITEAGNNLKNLTRAVAKFTSEVVGDLSVIALKDGSDSEIKIVAFSDSDPTGHALMRKVFVNNDKVDGKHSVMGGVIKSGEPLLIPSIDREQMKAITVPELKEYLDEVGIESVLIVPLIGRGGVQGALSLSRHRGSKPFKMDDQSFLMDIAYRTALAIENCRLFESLREEIAERLSTKQRLDSSEERFRAIFKSTTLGIKVLDLDGNILQTNTAFQKMLGYSNAEFFGRHFSEFIFLADVPQALRLIQDLKVSSPNQVSLRTSRHGQG